MTKIIQDLRNGNPSGEGYSLKEIMTAHIHDDKEFQEKVFTELKEYRKSYIPKKMFFGILTILIGWISWLSAQIWIFTRIPIP